ncbi:DNA gyrase subunit A [Pseudoramibacter sp.]|uniref:DNA gyrase subunit A n=1 Tax=Pseudoramibacter sp. TaxID=2034862 RepID=UPI0025E10607|nr:DNA gyrase subunit A [Pseudoramibacter sp.]MCH4071911.1 DNA gyrase subunit A [Pseudoramibacter sp.]MCH4105679.1 DNA gyrase subunit A [Pseudoramibacter sp.]
MPVAKSLKDVKIEDEMKNCYIDYAMSVIIGRALPDVRDGLKPVHRRILYAMHQMGMTPDKPFRKSARIVGEVLGKYHPHGDSSVYDAMVRMAQDFSTRYLTVNGQGNFGSIDGDGAAAMRYTEAKMSKVAMEMLRDINKDTVDFIDNFDGSEKEPSVLPARFPHLLANGSQGIAVGMATNIPPHNLGEVCDGTIAYIDNPDITVDELMQTIKGPDFPTAGVILGKGGIRDAYSTGRGRIKVRSKVDIQQTKRGKQQIIVSELPYMVNKAKLIQKIAELVKDKTVEGITDIRDETDLKHGIRIVIDLKRDANATIILNQLYKHTQLQDTYGVIMLALVDGQPKILNLKQILYYYVEHQKEVVVRRTKFDLKKAEARAHILEGYRIALDNIDAVIKIIRESRDAKIAKARLMENFTLTDIQAQAILDMRLQRLTGLEREKIEEEYAALEKKIAEYKAILADEQLVLNIIKDQLRELKENYGDPRRTSFDIDMDDFNMEDLIKEEEVVVTMTHIGYVKRISADTYRSQKRGGKGISALSTRENDFIEHIFTCSSHDDLLFFTNKGKYYNLKAYEIPVGGRTARGTAIVNILDLDSDENITTMIQIKDFDEPGKYLAMATRQGLIKKTALSDYSSSRKNGINGIKLKDGDELINVRIADDSEDIVMGTHEGYAIRFHVADIRPTGRTSMGVRGINLRSGDEVVGMDILSDVSDVLCVSEKGYGKRTPAEQYRIQNRGGKGVQTYKCSKKTGKLVGFNVIDDGGEIMMINNEGIVIKLKTDDISKIGRSTQGVRLMRLKGDERIATICKVQNEEPEDEEQMDMLSDSDQ